MNEAIPTILMFLENGFEDMEVMYPKYRLQEAGYRVLIAGPKAGQQYLGKHGYPCTSEASFTNLEESDFCGVICPGGWAPDKLRREIKVKALVSEFSHSGKLVAAICHGGWIPISAGVYRGIRVTGSLGIKDDLINAGALFEDSAVVVDRHFVSSRKPDDLPMFLQGILEVLERQAKNKSENLKQFLTSR